MNRPPLPIKRETETSHDLNPLMGRICVEYVCVCVALVADVSIELSKI